VTAFEHVLTHPSPPSPDGLAPTLRFPRGHRRRKPPPPELGYARTSLVAATAIETLGVAEIPLGADAPARLARLRAQTGLKLPDCCVLLAAQDAAARSILSLDERLVAAAEHVA
jgi:hypothetical protein